MNTRKRFNATAVLAQLQPFQRNTVEHVVDNFYGEDRTTRFLVADETGLGKSIVAKGVIAKAIERLQDDDSVKRIDIVYVCSNIDLARQNLSRLNVTKEPDLAAGSRLSLLAAHTSGLTKDDGRWLKPIKLISFTPGTSFDTDGNTGNVDERLLLLEILSEQLGLHSRSQWRAAYSAFQAGVKTWQRMERYHLQLRQEWDVLDPAIVAEVRAKAGLPDGDQPSLVDHFQTLITDLKWRTKLTEAELKSAADGFKRGRRILSRAGIELLEPDLIILDEFQRFKDLLSEETGAGRLAHELFNQPTARVLLLSATPYKPYTLAEESATDDHQTDLLASLQFLANGRPGGSTDLIAHNLRAFRMAVVNGGDCRSHGEVLRGDLLRLMSRAERPDAIQRHRVKEDLVDVDEVTVDDLLAFAKLSAAARLVDETVPVEYWKSAPYFANFMDGYALKRQIDATLVSGGATCAALSAELLGVQQLYRDDLSSSTPIDMGNGKLRQLASQTIGANWHHLLWVPPTLPYLTPGGPYTSAADMTKKLIFSSWVATPTAIASLLSYEAERRITEQSESAGNEAPRGRVRARLTYRLEGGRPSAMSTLALFWPMPGLAKIGDPLKVAASHGQATDPAKTTTLIEGVVREWLPPGTQSSATAFEQVYWAAAFGFKGNRPINERKHVRKIADRLSSATGAADDSTADEGVVAHIDAIAGLDSGGTQPPDLAQVVAELACYSPANCAWRALHRLAQRDGVASDDAVWLAAVSLATGLRSLFNRPEAILLLTGLYPQDGRNRGYWRDVLQYCADGNLQAVLDEYLYQLASDIPGELDDSRIQQIAEEAAAALSLRRTNYQAFDPSNPGERLLLSAHFALRYGGRKVSTDQGSMRPSEVRGAFNSPFWPFVLASTSVGQEGMDFHHWSHSLVHWNVPANPVDFEQREGRVDRYRGHAIRKNVVAELGQRILRSSFNRHPWEIAYELASEEHDRQDGLSPDWLFEGPAKIERTLFQYPLSRDVSALERIKQDLAQYRLAFGQSRQEDFLLLLRATETLDSSRLRIDLRAPAT